MERDVERLVELVVLLEEGPLAEPGHENGMADEEMGSSSVAPWTRPSTKACQSVSAPGSSPTPAAASTAAAASAAAAVA